MTHDYHSGNGNHHINLSTNAPERTFLLMKTIHKYNDAHPDAHSLFQPSLREPPLWLIYVCKGPEVRVRHPTWEKHMALGPKLIKELGLSALYLPFILHPCQGTNASSACPPGTLTTH